MTAEALVSRQLLGWPRDFPALIKGAGQVAAHLQSNRASGTSITGTTPPSSCIT